MAVKKCKGFYPFYSQCMLQSRHEQAFSFGLSCCPSCSVSMSYHYFLCLKIVFPIIWILNSTQLFYLLLNRRNSHQRKVNLLVFFVLSLYVLFLVRCFFFFLFALCSNCSGFSCDSVIKQIYFIPLFLSHFFFPQFPLISFSSCFLHVSSHLLCVLAASSYQLQLSVGFLFLQYFF